MPDFKDFIADRTAKAPLSGTESVPIVDGGITKKTTAQAIADLAPVAVSSVDGQTGAVVLSGSYAPTVQPALVSSSEPKTGLSVVASQRSAICRLP